MPPPFPLLRLPHLAFHEVFKQFGLAETFFMSLCSKKTNRFMKCHQNKSYETKISVIVFDGARVLSISRETAGQYIELSIKETSNVRPSSFEKCILVKEKEKYGLVHELHVDLHWNDWLDGFKIATVHFTELFGIPVTSLSLLKESFPNQFRKLADWFRCHQNTIKRLTCKFSRISDEDISYILSSCIPTRKLILNQDDSREFRINFPSYNLRQAKLFGNIKLSLDNLKSFDCLNLCANEAKVSMKNLNGLLKHWINGGNSRAKELYIGTEPFDLAVLFDGIEMMERDNEVVRTFYSMSGRKRTVIGGFDITRNDGKIATIQNPNNDVLLRTSFEMIVWN